MADFEPSVELVLKHEGGFTPGLPNDPGGATKFGISQRSYPDLDIPNLTVDEAKAIYLRDYWRFDGISDQHLANCALDAAVNQGPLFAKITLANNPDLASFQAARLEHYREIINHRPADAAFMKSWTHRVYDC